MKTPSAKSHPVRSALLWFGAFFVLLVILLVLSVCLPLLFNKTSLFPPRFFPSSLIGHENYQTANRQQNKPHQLLNNQLLVIAFRLSSLTTVTL